MAKKDPCWKGYKQVGMKKKNGREVPNCVPVKEDTLVEKNVPTNPSLWSKMKSRAKAKFDVYPSAYANGWAAKEYKKAGGGWKTQSESVVKEDLRKWFGKGGKGGVGGGGWDRYNEDGERVGKCAREEGEPKPKCLSKEKAAKMSKDEIGNAVRRKREEDPVADRKGKGGKPKMVSNKQESVEYVDEKLKMQYGKPGKLSQSSKRKALGRGSSTKDGSKPTGYESKKEFRDSEKKMAPYMKEGKTFEQFMEDSTPAWQRKAGKDPSGGLNKKGVESYRRENPGSKLQTAVTTKPSKLKAGSKSANR